MTKPLLLLILITLAMAPFAVDGLTWVRSLQTQINEIKRVDRPLTIVHVHSGAIMDLIVTPKEVIFQESGVSTYSFIESGVTE